MNESLTKHINPALNYHQNKNELYILDICFGLGYNTLATLYKLLEDKVYKKVHIYSPEFDKELLDSLKSFSYPKQFEPFKDIIQNISNHHFYKDKNIFIEVYNGDARKYLKELQKKDIRFDIVYQDAFSSDVNRSLWTKEYFENIKTILNEDAIITTYSIATPVRLSMWENNLSIYEISSEGTNKSTIALNKIKVDPRYKFIDMNLKLQRNKAASALYDKDKNGF